MIALNNAQIELVINARHTLHMLAEPSEKEAKTKEFVLRFIETYTDLQLYDMGKWCYAVHAEKNATKTIVIRADMDAVAFENGQCYHACGHDGHTAALLGVALLLNGNCVGNNIVLLFQHAEETGRGAAECVELFNRIWVDEVIGCHNIPGYPVGKVLLRDDTMACASCGAAIGLNGTPAHAAYPENGKNPAYALAQLVNGLQGIVLDVTNKYSCMALATIVGLECGGEFFGVAASMGKLCVTLRAETDTALNCLINNIENSVAEAARKNGLDYCIEYRDTFPATLNNKHCTQKLRNVCINNSIPYSYLDEPFRWSEDFGHYTKYKDCVMFGIGSGISTPPLHTSGYEYPDELIAYTVPVFMSYIMQSS